MSSLILHVTILVDKHECVSIMRMSTATPNCKWVASKVVAILRSELKISCKELQLRLEKEHKCQIAYDTVWRGKARALDEVYGKWSDSFELLFRWKAEVMKRSPRSVIEIDVLEADGEIYFSRFSCALKPCIEGFLEGCRPHLSVFRISNELKGLKCHVFRSHNVWSPILAKPMLGILK